LTTLIHTKPRNSPVRQWDKWAELHTRLHEAVGSMSHILYIGLPEDIPYIRNNVGDWVNMQTGWSFKELTEQMRRANLFIGVNSAPMHVALAVGTPTVALIGETSPVVVFPVDKDKKYQYLDGTGGMNLISVDQVLQKVKLCLS